MLALIFFSIVSNSKQEFTFIIGGSGFTALVIVLKDIWLKGLMETRRGNTENLGGFIYHCFRETCLIISSTVYTMY